MKVKIQSVRFDADQKLLDFIDERVNKLVTFNSTILDAEVILRVENSSTTDNKVVEIKLLVPGPDLFAKRQCKTFEEATDLSVEALRSQIKKLKEKAMP
ncbi:MAG: ribosome-associated translation inhibitor RaiA [Flavobacteriales bacterium]|nr:ribosome-associated translation inhibitor RaiA [Flavobacteriales bacterium]